MPAADASAVALVYGRHRLVVLDPATGGLVWELEHRRLRDVAPLLLPDAVVVPTEGGLMAADRGTRGLRWEADLGDRANTPVPVAGRLVTTTWEGRLIAVDARSGKPGWSVDLPGAAMGQPAASDRVVVASWDSGRKAGVVAVDAATGAGRWAVEVPADGVSAPAVHTGGGRSTVVVVAGDATVRAFALDSGAPLWQVEVEGAGSPEIAPVPIDGDQVLVAHRQGGLAMLTAAVGEVVWQASSPEAAVRGGPAGPSPGGSFALPLYDGRLLLAGPDRPGVLYDPPSFASGVVALASGWLVVTTTQGEQNEVTAVSGW